MEEEKLTIGQLAKILHISVRTLQYYDQIGLMSPAEITASGRRMYRKQDITLLHQIISLKTLGFSLEEIKNQLMPINDTQDVVHLLQQQAEIMNNQIQKLQKSVDAIHVLETEIARENEVDWYKYSQMVNLIQQNSDYYWVMKHLDKTLITHMVEQETTPVTISPGWWQEIFELAITYAAKGLTPESEPAQALAAKWWTQMQKISGGDATMIDKMVEFYYSADEWPAEFKQLQQQAQAFMEQAFLHYIETNKIQIVRRDES